MFNFKVVVEKKQRKNRFLLLFLIIREAHKEQVPTRMSVPRSKPIYAVLWDFHSYPPPHFPPLKRSETRKIFEIVNTFHVVRLQMTYISHKRD